MVENVVPDSWWNVGLRYPEISKSRKYSQVERYRKLPREVGTATTRGRPLGTRAPVRSWKERLIKMERYGGGHPAREKPHTSPRGNFTSRIHRWSSAGYALADISTGR